MPTLTSRLSRHALAIGAAMLVLYVVWGSTYLGIAVAIETIPPFLMAGLRFLIAGLVLLAWSALREGRAFRLPSRRELRDTAIVGALLLGGGMGLVAWGEQTVASGIAALMIAMMPLWVAVFGRTFLGERLPMIAAAGVVVGLVGVGVLVWPFGALEDRLEPAGVVALLLSPILWASGSLFAQHRARQPARPLVATAFQMLAGSATLFVLALLNGEYPRFDLAEISSRSLVAFVYLTVIGSLLAFTAYVWLLKMAPLPLIATYAYVNPVVAVALGAAILGEAITPRTLVGGAIIVGAVAVIITARSRMRRPAPQVPAEAARPEVPRPASALGQHRP